MDRQQEEYMQLIIDQHENTIERQAQEIAALKAAAPITEDYVLVFDCDEGTHPKYGRGYFFTENCIKSPDSLQPVAERVQPVAVPEGWALVPRKMTDEQACETVYNINRKYKVSGPLSDFLVRQIWEWAIHAKPAVPSAPAVQVQDAGQLIVATGNDDPNVFTVVVSVKRGDQTTVVYSQRHQANGDGIGVSELPFALTAAPAKPAAPKLTVWHGPMPESNGKSNFTATLKREGASIFDTDSYTFQISEYPDRVRYEADCMRYLIGEIDQKPDIMAYDADKHSGYVAPKPAAPDAQDAADAARWREALKYVGADRSPALGISYFVLRGIDKASGTDLMRGSVAQHFTEAIEAARASKEAAQ